ncbi:hypothetical protein BJX99DRAFT_256651 [Aspergillus californicus]
MDVYNLPPSKYPRQSLYRVQYDESCTKYDVQHGLCARDTLTFYDGTENRLDKKDFKTAVDNHLHWSSRHSSIFISLFSDQNHADRWLLRRHDNRNCKDCFVLEIDPSKLEYVYKAQDLVDALSIDVYPGAKESVKEEYLVAYRILAEAIVGRSSLEAIQRRFIRQPRSVPMVDENAASDELLDMVEKLRL